MMVCLSICALIFVWMAAAKPRESLACGETMFKRNEQKYLAGHVIETKQAQSEMECGLHCIESEKSCTSVNFKTSGIGKADVNSTIRQLKKHRMFMTKNIIQNLTILLSSNELA